MVVSLELHVSLEQQPKMVEIMRETWGDMLLDRRTTSSKTSDTPTASASTSITDTTSASTSVSTSTSTSTSATPSALEMTQTEQLNAGPPLSDLRRKILIKVKGVPEKSTTTIKEEDDHTQDQAGDAETDAESGAAMAPANRIRTSDSDQSSDAEVVLGKDSVSERSLTLTSAPSSAPDATEEGKKAGSPEKYKKKRKKPTKVIEALGRLAVYTRSYHFSSLDQPEATVPNHVFSLSEKSLMSLHETHGAALFHHNRHFLMRAYPKGLRVSSSNLDPSVFWRKGVQMVALNWQRWDEGMMLNEGMFAGTNGWVLKPRGYRGIDNQTSSDAMGQAAAIDHKTLDLSIQVFAAQDLPLPLGNLSPSAFHPYVKAELHVEKATERSGAPIEGGGRSKEGEHKCHTRSLTGIDPDFDGEVLSFTGIPGVVDELSFLRYVLSSSIRSPPLLLSFTTATHPPCLTPFPTY
ncbi:MAG: hypothetical protein M1838_000065 [Thelocarpon superellum]|nr:MAG: hypothetical protein M1838_000065 [Thelocarpon superellum]